MHVNRGRVIAAVALLFVTSYFPLISNEIHSNFLDLEKKSKDTGQGQDVDIYVDWPNTTSYGLNVDILDGESFTHLGMEMTSGHSINEDIIEWNSLADWSHYDAFYDNVDINGTFLTTPRKEVLWDFNTGLQGWTVSSPTYVGQYIADTCGYNGSIGGSLKTQASTTTPEHATSPVLNLAGYSSMPLHAWIKQGSFNCGEEADAGEDLKVQYKALSGNWVDVHTFSGSTPGGTAQQWSTNLPAAALHATSQIRMTQIYGSGTCCDYWFIDDVRVSDTERGNWTSPSFGSHASAVYDVEPGQYGVVSINGLVPYWSVLDGVTNEPILGFENINSTRADLGTIDWQEHPSLRIAVSGQFKIESINIQGKIKDTFLSNPSDTWSGNYAWDAEKTEIVSSNTITSSMIKSHRPIAGWDLNFDVTSGAQPATLEISVDGGAWYEVDLDDSTQHLPSPAHTVQFRVSVPVNSGSTQFIFEEYDVELHYASLPENLKLNIADDDILDWSLDKKELGPWGWQNRFVDGGMVQSLNLVNNNSKQTAFWLPSETIIESFSFDYWSDDVNQNIAGVHWELFCGNLLVDAVTHNGAIKSERATYRFSEDKLNGLNTALENGDIVNNSAEGIDFVNCTLDVSGSGGTLMIDGLLVRYTKSIDLQFGLESKFLDELNAFTANMQSGTGNILEIPIPVTTAYSSKLNFEIYDINTVSGMSSILVDFVNDSTTLTASENWLELVTKHTSMTEALDTVQVEILGVNNRVILEWPISGGAPTITTNGEIGTELIELHPTDSAEIVVVSTTPQELDATFRFRLNPLWDDEPFVKIYSRVSTPEGYDSLPAVKTFGSIGGANGIENDYYISEWNVVNDLGVVIPSNLSYIKASAVVTFSVKLAYEGLADGSAPRSDLLLLTLYQNEIVVAQTQDVDGNLMNMTIALPPTEEQLSFSLDLEQIVQGGDDLTTINLSRDFQTDSRAPVVMDSNVEKYDHRSASNTQTLSFEIADRPILPASLTLMLWRQWVNDKDNSKSPDPDEFEPFPLIAPENLTTLHGNFTYVFSDLLAEEGDLVAGYLIGADVAGNELEMGGSSIENQQLFTYQVKPDGAPLLTEDGAKWLVDSSSASFRNPMMFYSMSFPINEPNGLSDLDLISLNLDDKLSGEEEISEALEIHWDGASRECGTESNYIVLDSCDVFAKPGNFLDEFTEDFEFSVTFALAWDLENSGQVRTPEIMAIDRAGNEDILAYPTLNWNFNAEITIPYDLIMLEFSSGNQGQCPYSPTNDPLLKCAWVSPGSEIKLSGEVQFFWTKALPTEELHIEVMLSSTGTPTLAKVENGTFSVILTAPLTNGGYVLSWNLFSLPLTNIDSTSKFTASIVVDGDAPLITEVIKPRIDVELQIDEMYSIEFEATFKETQFNTSDLKLNWRVIYDENPSVIVVEGSENLEIVMNSEMGTLSGIIQVGAYLLDTHYSKPSTLQFWITGSDMAENPIDANGNSPSEPLAEIPIHFRHPIIDINPSDIQYGPSGEQNSGELIDIIIVVRNEGDAGGEILFTIYEVLPSGTSKRIASSNESIPLNSQPFQLKYEWVPNVEGLNHIRVEWEGQSLEGPFIDILPPKAVGLNAVFEETNPMLVLSFVGLIVSVLILLIVALRKGKIDDYEDYWIEEEDEVVQTSQGAIVKKPVSSPKTQVTPPPQPEPETRYQNNAYEAAYEVAKEGKGKGWWQDEHGQWWQKSDDGQWWHQSPDGEWHKLEGY